jgi:hypothetical protein
MGWRKYISVIKYVEVLRKQSSKPFPNFWRMVCPHKTADNLKLILNIQDQNKNCLNISCLMTKPRLIQWRHSEAYPIQSGRTVPLKGQCHEIFYFRLGFRHGSVSPKPLIIPPVLTTELVAKFAAGVVDTGGGP